MKDLISAFSIFGAIVGTVVGAGIFSLPFVAYQAGIGITLIYMAVLAAIMTVVHLLYGEVTLRTKDSHRLVGYTQKYLGNNAKNIIGSIVVTGMLGGLLIYIILGGSFLEITLSGVLDITQFEASILFFVIGTLLAMFGLKSISISELFFVLAITVSIFLVGGKGISEGIIEPDNFRWFRLENWYIPYGAVLFSFSGIAAIPALEDITDGFDFKTSIIWATIAPIFIYLLFILIVVGISGAQTSPNSLSGLQDILDGGLIRLVALFGLISLLSSFVMFADSLKKTFNYDFNLSKKTSFVLTLGIPILALILGLNHSYFIKILSIVGAVMGGMTGILIPILHKKSKEFGDEKPLYSVTVPGFVYAILPLFFIAGIITQLITTL